MYGHFRGMMQVVADYYQKEVVVFTRPENSLPANQGIYQVEVYGQQYLGIQNGQILLVTDFKKEHYQLVIRQDARAMAYNPGVDPVFDTSNFSAQDRYGWILAPWMPAPGVPLHPAYAPEVLGPWIPRNDPAWAPSYVGINNDFLCFPARAEAVCSDDNYGNGRYPNFPDPVGAGWITERPPPGALVPSFPYGFSPNLIVNGVYTTPTGTYWPRWTNIRTYKAQEWLAKAKDMELLTVPQPESQ